MRHRSLAVGAALAAACAAPAALPAELLAPAASVPAPAVPGKRSRGAGARRRLQARSAQPPRPAVVARAATAMRQLPAAAVGLLALTLAGGLRRLLARTGGRGRPRWVSAVTAALRLKEEEEAKVGRAAEFRPELPALSPGELRQLDGGRRVQRQEREGPVGWGFVVADVAAPPDVVMDCLQAYEDYPMMIPVVRHAQIHARAEERDGTSVAHCSYTISKFRLGISVKHTVYPGPPCGVRFDLDNSRFGSVLQECAGYWYVEPSPAGGGGSSRVWLHVEGLRTHWLLPSWLVDYAAERALRKAFGWLRPHAEEVWRAADALR